MREHLKTICPRVRLQCSECHDMVEDHSSKPRQLTESNSYSRTDFKKHNCYLQMQETVKAFETNRNFMIEQAKSVFDSKRLKVKEYVNNYKEVFKCANGCDSSNVAKYILKNQDLKFDCSSCKADIFRNEGYLKC